jgi:predicted ester cyclase
MGGTGIERLVRRFYDELWNRWDDAAVDDLLDEAFVFRGSLGDAVRGRDGFRAYRDKVRAAFPDFHNEIVDLIAGDGRAAARLRYSGHHRGEILDVAPTGAAIAYAGAAFFTGRAPVKYRCRASNAWGDQEPQRRAPGVLDRRSEDGRLSEVWVLGDLDGLRRQLAEAGG